MKLIPLAFWRPGLLRRIAVLVLAPLFASGKLTEKRRAEAFIDCWRGRDPHEPICGGTFLHARKWCACGNRSGMSHAAIHQAIRRRMILGDPQIWP